ncbi:bifunctional SKI-interacting protein SKIP [Babesia duncani]|uniref:Bifunctional SKI-interacting protein SKIP n=1 Tax=Babesia duncani TaxID=323732 RepID=A0AAD9PJ08_9APIC|nr:bifunctional SKI-interacting protein SKIP [Babesia duncani]
MADYVRNRTSVPSPHAYNKPIESLGSFSIANEGDLEKTTTNTLALRYDENKKPQFDLVLRQGLRENQIMYTSPTAQMEKRFSNEQLARPSDSKVQETVNRTKQALESAMSRIKASNLHAATQAPKEAEIFRYTPNQTNQGQIKQRLIRMVEKQIDPLEPSKHRHKKVPAGPPSPPAPLQHSPPRKLTAEDQKAWKIPPCVSNWKNQNGYTIPIDKRVQADGRRLQHVYISGKHAELSESLDIAVRTAREEVALRNQAQREQARRDAQAKEEQLRKLAAQAREQRQGVNVNDKLYLAEMERKRELEREFRLERAGKKLKAAAQRNERRDVSERVALGQANPTVGADLYDARLVNTSAGIDSGFNAGEDENYNIYDKPLFSNQTIHGIYKHSKERLGQSVGETFRVAAFANADRDVVRTTPVEFVKDTHDPFGFGTLVNKAQND